MATVLKPLEEKDETLQGQEGEGVKQLSTGAEALTPGGSASTDISREVGAPQGTTAPTGGQETSEQQKYLEANREKALQLAGKTAGVVTGDVTKAQGSLTGAGEQYQKAVQGATVNLDQDLYGRASSALVDQTAPTYNVNLTNQFMADQAAQDAFRQQYNAEYTGPRDIYSQDYYAQAAREAAKAQRTMGLVDEATGRQELISRTYDDPSGRFNRGVLALDESLLTGYEDAYNQLLAAKDTGLGLEGQMTGLGEMSEREYLAAKQATEATREQMRKQFNLGGEETEIKTQAEAIKEKAKKDYEDYLKYIQNTYGVKEGVQATSYFDRPQDYLNINAQNVMSTSDVARMKALESLTNNVGTLTPFEKQAGQYKDYIDPAADFRLSDFQSKVDTEKAARLKREADEAARIKAIQDAEAAAAAAAKEQQKQATGTAIGTAVGAGAGAAIGGPVGAVIGGVVGGAIGGIVCFDGASEFEMEDGTHKRIKDIRLGDVMKEGGVVYSLSSHILQAPLYSYPTKKEDCYIWVTGSHAVKEDKWVRVENSRKATILDGHEIDVVYSLSNENHIMISHGVIFADYAEVDNDQGLTDEQCLHILNGGN